MDTNYPILVVKLTKSATRLFAFETALRLCFGNCQICKTSWMRIYRDVRNTSFMNNIYRIFNYKVTLINRNGICSYNPGYFASNGARRCLSQ